VHGANVFSTVDNVLSPAVIALKIDSLWRRGNRPSS